MAVSPVKNDTIFCFLAEFCTILLLRYFQASLGDLDDVVGNCEAVFYAAGQLFKRGIDLGVKNIGEPFVQVINRWVLVIPLPGSEK